MYIHVHMLYTERTKAHISTQAFSSKFGLSLASLAAWQRLGNQEFFRRQASYAQAEEALREECRRERWAFLFTGFRC